MKKDPNVYLRHVLESIRLVEKRIKGIRYEEFEKNVDLQDMVVWRIQVIGEAIKNLPDEYKANYADIDWHNPAGMRNALIHGYADIDFEIVWRTVKDDLPKLKNQIKDLLR